MKERNATTIEKVPRDSIGQKAKIYNLEEGLEVVIKHVIKRTLIKSPVVVEIAGGSASGKTEIVATGLKNAFGDDAIVISMDDYYYDKTRMAVLRETLHTINYDQPASMDLDLIKMHVNELRAGRSITKPVYDIKTESADKHEIVHPVKVIILEGMFALYPGIFELGDIRVFVDIGLHGRLMRRLFRDMVKADRKPVDILNNFANQVQPMHELFVEPSKVNADFIIENEYKPDVEAQRSGLHEVQKKFEFDISSENLRILGAERLGYFLQIDYYYNPKDRNLMETDEILRIRVEGNKRILTYKGPISDKVTKKRPKFEFEIDEATANKFLDFYGSVIKIIKKERTMYSIQDIVFSADSVYKVENGQEKFIGNFIELKSNNEIDGEYRIKSALSKLNLNLSDGIKKSYFEM